MWCCLFKALSYAAPFKGLYAAVRMARWRKATASCVIDAWAIGHSVLAVIALALSRPAGRLWWEWVLLAYGMVRIIEIVVYQVNVLFFDPYRAKKQGKAYAFQGYRRVVLLALHNYAEILLWFALWYRNNPTLFEVPTKLNLNTFCCSLYYSLTTMSTLGYGDISPDCHKGLALVVPQTVIGIFMTVLIFARFLALLPKPGTMDSLEREETLETANKAIDSDEK
ncbi:Ion channel [Sedimentisphaera salicampi]|nr:Ion channel [Sedimentisphaera salicampi]